MSSSLSFSNYNNFLDNISTPRRQCFRGNVFSSGLGLPQKPAAFRLNRHTSEQSTSELSLKQQQQQLHVLKKSSIIQSPRFGTDEDLIETSLLKQDNSSYPHLSESFIEPMETNPQSSHTSDIQSEPSLETFTRISERLAALQTDKVVSSHLYPDKLTQLNNHLSHHLHPSVNMTPSIYHSTLYNHSIPDIPEPPPVPRQLIIPGSTSSCSPHFPNSNNTHPLFKHAPSPHLYNSTSHLLGTDSSHHMLHLKDNKFLQNETSPSSLLYSNTSTTAETLGGQDDDEIKLTSISEPSSNEHFDLNSSNISVATEHSTPTLLEHTHVHNDNTIMEEIKALREMMTSIVQKKNTQPSLIKKKESSILSQTMEYSNIPSVLNTNRQQYDLLTTTDTVDVNEETNNFFHEENDSTTDSNTFDNALPSQQQQIILMTTSTDNEANDEQLTPIPNIVLFKRPLSPPPPKQLQSECISTTSIEEDTEQSEMESGEKEQSDTETAEKEDSETESAETEENENLLLKKISLNKCRKQMKQQQLSNEFLKSNYIGHPTGSLKTKQSKKFLCKQDGNQYKQSYLMNMKTKQMMYLPSYSPYMYSKQTNNNGIPCEHYTHYIAPNCIDYSSELNHSTCRKKNIVLRNKREESPLPVLTINGKTFALRPLNKLNPSKFIISDNNMPTQINRTIQQTSQIQIKPLILNTMGTMTDESNIAIETNDNVLQNTIESLQHTIKTLKKENEQCLIERENLATNLSGLTKELTAQRQLVIAQKDELSFAQQEACLSEKQLAAELVAIRTSRDDLQALLDVQETHLQAAHNGLDRLELERQRLSHELIALERIENDKEKILLSGKEKIKELETQLAQSLQDIQQLTIKLNQSESDNTRMTEKASKIEIENARLAAENESLKAQTCEINDAEERRRLLEMIKIQRDKCDKNENELKALRQELKVTTEEKDNIHKELLETTAELSIGLNETQQKFQDAIEREILLKKQLVSRREATIAESKEKRRLLETTQHLQQRIKEVEIMLETSETNTAAMVVELQHLQAELKKEKELTQTDSQLQIENSILQKKVLSLNESKQVLENDLRSTLQASRDLHEKVKELQHSGRLLTETEEKYLRANEAKYQELEKLKYMQKKRMNIVSVQHIQFDSKQNNTTTSIGVQIGIPLGRGSSRLQQLSLDMNGQYINDIDTPDDMINELKESEKELNRVMNESLLNRFLYQHNQSNELDRRQLINRRERILRRKATIAKQRKLHKTNKKTLQTKEEVDEDEEEDSTDTENRHKSPARSASSTSSKYSISGRVIKRNNTASSHQLDTEKQQTLQCQKPTHASQMRQLQSVASIKKNINEHIQQEQQKFDKKPRGKPVYLSSALGRCTDTPVFRRNCPNRIKDESLKQIESHPSSNTLRHSKNIQTDIQNEVHDSMLHNEQKSSGIQSHTNNHTKDKIIKQQRIPKIKSDFELTKDAYKASVAIQETFSRYKDQLLYKFTSPSFEENTITVENDSIMHNDINSINNNLQSNDESLESNEVSQTQETPSTDSIVTPNKGIPVKVIVPKINTSNYTIKSDDHSTIDTPEFGASFHSHHPEKDNEIEMNKVKLQELRQKLTEAGVLSIL